jgi:hypothetical protein
MYYKDAIALCQLRKSCEGNYPTPSQSEAPPRQSWKGVGVGMMDERAIALAPSKIASTSFRIPPSTFTSVAWRALFRVKE